MYFKVKTQEHRRFVGCLIVVIDIRKWRLIACVVIVTSWRLFVMRNKASHQLRLNPYRYIQKYETRLYICRSSTSLCQGFFVVSVNCDVTGLLWRHQKAVSCLGWDKPISDTRRLSRTPGCTSVSPNSPVCPVCKYSKSGAQNVLKMTIVNTGLYLRGVGDYPHDFLSDSRCENHPVSQKHDDVMTWIHFAHHWEFVQGYTGYR